MRRYSHHYYDGAWQAPAAADTIDVISSVTEQPIGCVPQGTATDVDRAVAAARRAFDDGWPETPVDERADWLERLATALRPRVPELADTITHEVGTAHGYAVKVQAEYPLTMLVANAGYARAHEFTRTLGHSLVVQEPVGVAGCITPWNYPLHQVVAKIAPALAMGCTVVLKPAEIAPLSTMMLAEAMHDIGFPRGVLNIVNGHGATAGDALVRHPGVDMISFTGSVATGRRVAALAGDQIKRVCLELGGKSAFVVLDDAPFEKAIPAGVNNCMQNSGQTCSAWTRLLVPRRRVPETIDLVSAQLQRLVMGDPFDARSKLGPLASAAQRDRVLRYIDAGRREGARLVHGGGRLASQATGYYVEPTVFADVTSRMTIAQEEIFGPVLAILAYDSEDEAVAIANDTEYGLAAGVWAGTQEQAMAIARRLRAGQVDVNGGRYNPLAPFGGYKKSGIGREMGPLALDEYAQHKSIQR